MDTKRLVTVRYFYGVETSDGKLLSDHPITEPVQMHLEQLHELLDALGIATPIADVAKAAEALDYNVLLMEIKDADSNEGDHIWITSADALSLAGVRVGELPAQSAKGLFSTPLPDKNETKH